MNDERAKRIEKYLENFNIEQLNDLLVDKTLRFLELLDTKKINAIEYADVKIEVEDLQEAIKVKKSTK
jgi:hypothetical protein